MPDQVVELHSSLLNDVIGYAARGRIENLQLFLVQNQRVHNLRNYFNAIFLALDGRFDDGADLHLQNFGIGDAQTATAVTQHRI